MEAVAKYMLENEALLFTIEVLSFLLGAFITNRIGNYVLNRWY
jgi:hypothetical protein